MRRDGIQPRCETFETCESAHRQAGLAAKGAAWAAGAARTGSAGRFHRRQCQWRARCPVQERGRPGFVYQGGVRHIGKISGNKNSYSYIEVRRGRGNYSIRIRRGGPDGRSRHRGSAGFPETRPPRGVVFRAAGPALSGLKIIIKAALLREAARSATAGRLGPARSRRRGPPRRVQPLASHTINRHTHSHSSNQCMGLILITLLPRRGAEARAVRAGLCDARRTCGPRHRVFKSLRQRGLAQCSMSTHRASLHETMPPPRAIRSPPPPATHSPKCGGAA